MKPIQLTRAQRKILTVTLISAGILSLFFGFVILPMQWKVRGLSTDVQKFSDENQKIQGMILSANRTGKNFQLILDRLEHYQKMIPNRETVSNILELIGSSAEVHQLDVQSLKPRTDKPYVSIDGKPFLTQGREAQELLINMEARGSFFSLGNYLAWLEKVPYKITVKEVEIKNLGASGGKASAGDDLNVNLTFGILTMVSGEAGK